MLSLSAGRLPEPLHGLRRGLIPHFHFPFCIPRCAAPGLAGSGNAGQASASVPLNPLDYCDLAVPTPTAPPPHIPAGVALDLAGSDVQDEVTGQYRAAGLVRSDGCVAAKRPVAGRFGPSGLSPAILALPTDQNLKNGVPQACVRRGEASWQRDGGGCDLFPSARCPCRRASPLPSRRVSSELTQDLFAGSLRADGSGLAASWHVAQPGRARR